MSGLVCHLVGKTEDVTVADALPAREEPLRFLWVQWKEVEVLSQKMAQPCVYF